MHPAVEEDPLLIFCIKEILDYDYGKCISS